MTTVSQTRKDTDIVYLGGGSDAFKSLQDAQREFEAYWDSLTPRQKKLERQSALHRQAERDRQEAKAD